MTSFIHGIFRFSRLKANMALRAVRYRQRD
jgi:hypothetical protein